MSTTILLNKCRIEARAYQGTVYLNWRDLKTMFKFPSNVTLYTKLNCTISKEEMAAHTTNFEHSQHVWIDIHLVNLLLSHFVARCQKRLRDLAQHAKAELDYYEEHKHKPWHDPQSAAPSEELAPAQQPSPPPLPLPAGVSVTMANGDRSFTVIVPANDMSGEYLDGLIHKMSTWLNQPI